MYAVTDLEQLLEFSFENKTNLDQCAKYKHNHATLNRYFAQTVQSSWNLRNNYSSLLIQAHYLHLLKTLQAVEITDGKREIPTCCD